MERLYLKSILLNCDLILVRAPTTKAVGSIDVTKLEPTALVVGAQKKRVSRLLRHPLVPREIILTYTILR